jgi:hypothetical protein
LIYPLGYSPYVLTGGSEICSPLEEASGGRKDKKKS